MKQQTVKDEQHRYKTNSTGRTTEIRQQTEQVEQQIYNNKQYR
jgi:hypothetical protein